VTRSIQTTAGEWEREARSRRFNLYEAMSVMVLVLVALWPLHYGFGVLGGFAWAEPLSVGVLALGVVYLLFVSPFLHRDTASSWGLGNPRTLWRLLSTGPMPRRVAVGLSALTVFLILNVANYTLWPEVADFLNIDKTAAVNWHQEWPGRLYVLAFGFVVGGLLTTCVLRYDNFLSAFRTACMIALPLCAVIVSIAVWQRGMAAFEDFNAREIGLDIFGYIFWGALQQLLFSAWFGTRFRKAFAPGQGANNRQPTQRWALALQFGAVGCVVFTALLYGSLRLVYGADAVSTGIIPKFGLYLFLVSAVFGYFFALDRKRLLVAVLSASCFGLIHIPSYLLLSGTWLLGVALVYVFMEAKNRNLFALGFIHGLNGSVQGWLFSSGQAGALEVEYSVGPTSLDDPTFAVLWFPLIAIGVYTAIAYAWRNRLEPAPA